MLWRHCTTTTFSNLTPYAVVCQHYSVVCPIYLENRSCKLWQSPIDRESKYRLPLCARWDLNPHILFIRYHDLNVARIPFRHERIFTSSSRKTLCRVRVSNSPCRFRDESFTGSLPHLRRHGMFTTL